MSEGSDRALAMALPALCPPRLRRGISNSHCCTFVICFAVIAGDIAALGNEPADHAV